MKRLTIDDSMPPVEDVDVITAELQDFCEEKYDNISELPEVQQGRVDQLRREQRELDEWMARVPAAEHPPFSSGAQNFLTWRCSWKVVLA